MKRNRKKFIILSALSILLLNTKNINAYTFQQTGVTNPRAVTVYNVFNTSGYLNSLNYYKKWTSTGIMFATFNNGLSSDVLVNMSDIDNGTYGVTTYKSIGKFTIVYYKAFKNASSIVQQETVVHEFEHALDLGHTQTSNESKSVMRALGFNKKAYPLSDDISGIKAKYNF